MGGWEGGALLFPLEAIDFQATYALFVCTDTLECKLVKCEVHHLSLAGPHSHLPGGLSANKHTHTHRVECGLFCMTSPVVSRSHL